MRRINLAVVLVTVALVTAAVVAVSSASAAAPKLVGTVGPDFTITLKHGSAKVKTLKAGRYTIVVSDKSSSHDFHLFGPGVNKTTSIGGTGKAAWKVTFQKGKTYRFVCDAHATFMKGSFKVT